MGTLNFAGGASLSGSGSNLQSTSGLDFGSASWVDAPPGTIIQTVWGGLTAQNAANLITITSSSATEVDTDLRVTITPKRSNSVMLVSWSSTVRSNTSTNGSIYPRVSTDGGSTWNNNFVYYTGGSFQEMFRNANAGTMWQSLSLDYIDNTTTGTTQRIYSLFSVISNGTLYIGDNGLSARIVVQEIAQ
jgi:hypothetical protein